MGIVQLFKDIFESLFMGSSPEIQKKQQLHRLESELRLIQPVIYKGGFLQPNFAEAIRQLYIHAKPLDNIFSATINSDDVKRNEHFMDELVITGFTPEEQLELESLIYEARKKAVQSADANPLKIFEAQRRIMNKLVTRLNTPEFLKIDVVLADLMQLSDFCRFNFISILTMFDRNFTGLDPDYHPDFLAVEPKSLEKLLEDMFFLCGNLKITHSVANAVLALLQIKTNAEVPEMQRRKILKHLQTIYYIVNRVLTPSTLKMLIALAKENTAADPALASYRSSARQKFSAHFQEYFEADERRIKQELKDETTTSELNELFGTHSVEHLDGYNTDLNNALQDNSSLALLWIRPLDIIKTFLIVYLTEPIKTLLNDIVIEGFFNNQNYKSQFSSTVYTCTESLARLKAFESNFEHNGKYDTAKINGYIRDSHKNTEFTKQLTSMVNQLNDEAKELVVNETASLFGLYSEIGDLLTDAKKAKNEIIDNLKVLMMSSRNRDSSDMLEKQYPSWRTFFEIMKNYAIINLKGN